MVVVVVASVGHPVAALQRCSVAVWLNSLLVVVFLFYILFLLLSMLFLLLWLWWPVLVILWRLLKGARWRCWRYNFTALFVLPAPCSSHLLAIIIIIIISSNQMHVWRKKGLIEKDRREISTTFAPSRSIDLFDVDVTCVFDPRYY